MACSLMINPENNKIATKLDQSFWKYLTPTKFCPLTNIITYLSFCHMPLSPRFLIPWYRHSLSYLNSVSRPGSLYREASPQERNRKRKERANSFPLLLRAPYSNSMIWCHKINRNGAIFQVGAWTQLWEFASMGGCSC